eukprot:6455305-Amphidinium_carterae.1
MACRPSASSILHACSPFRLLAWRPPSLPPPLPPPAHTPASPPLDTIMADASLPPATFIATASTVQDAALPGSLHMDATLPRAATLATASTTERLHLLAESDCWSPATGAVWETSVAQGRGSWNVF